MCWRALRCLLRLLIWLSELGIQFNHVRQNPESREERKRRICEAYIPTHTSNVVPRWLHTGAFGGYCGFVFSCLASLFHNCRRLHRFRQPVALAVSAKRRVSRSVLSQSGCTFDFCAVARLFLLAGGGDDEYRQQRECGKAA